MSACVRECFVVHALRLYRASKVVLFGNAKTPVTDAAMQAAMVLSVGTLHTKRLKG